MNTLKRSLQHDETETHRWNWAILRGSETAVSRTLYNDYINYRTKRFDQN